MKNEAATSPADNRILDLYDMQRACVAEILAIRDDASLSGAEYVAKTTQAEAAWKAIDAEIRAIHPLRAVKA